MTARPSFTIGIEEEFQVIDPATRELRSHIAEIFEQAERGSLAGRMKPELHQSVVEIGTEICRDVAEARRDVAATRASIARLARENGLRIAAAGTHPFSHWADVGITANPRYERLISDLQVVARANLIFGLHVHVGVEDREMQIRIMNQARYFLPHVFALSVNSPFWLGRETGWMSYRSKVFDKFPRTNIPDFFSSYAEFQEFVGLLVRTKCVLDGRQIWWDVRPHPIYATLEYRISDIPMRVEETICIAALFQAITAKLWLLAARNLAFRPYRRALIMENKLRAARWGVKGLLIDFGKQEEVPYASLLQELMEFVDEVLDDLGSREAVMYALRILEHGTGAERQLKVWRETGDLRAVMDYVVQETEHGLGVTP